MTFELITHEEKFKPKDLVTFVDHLRKFQLKTILKSSGFLCWEAFRNQKFRKEHWEKLHLVNAYTPKVSLLALATANDTRNLTIDIESFYDLCNSFLALPSTISDKEFMNKEAALIAEDLRKISDKKNSITEDKIDESIIRETCAIVFISRKLVSQHRGFINNINELYRDYQIIKLIDNKTSGAASEILANFFGLEVFQIFRAAFCLFAFAHDTNRNGIIDLDSTNFDEDLARRFKVDNDICKKVAHIISYKQSDLREQWLEKEVLTEELLYQPYVSDPTFLHPIIHMNKGVKENKFIIISPQLYIRAFRKCLFKTLFDNAEKKAQMGNYIGSAIENHIEDALKSIFTSERVTKLKDEGKKADFLISLDKVNLIVEVKTDIGGMSDKTVMKPDQVAQMWNRFYGACEQCASSAKKHQDESKKTFAIIIVADHITAEYLPFHHYAEKSGIFDEMGIKEVEFISWNALENRLSKTSVSAFEDALIEKWGDPDSMSVEDIIGLEMRREEPAHAYEYLKECENEIFNRVI